jgi:oligopeptide transport system permease protein
MGRVSRPGAGTEERGTPRYAWQEREARHLPPSWSPWGWSAEAKERLRMATASRAALTHARQSGLSVETLQEQGWTPSDAQARSARPFYGMGTDLLGRDVFVRALAGGGVSLTIGILAAAVAVVIGTLYGAAAGYIGGRTDAVMMRIVDVLYGLPYVLLVVLLAVAADAVMDEHITRAGARRAHVLAGAVEHLRAAHAPAGSEDARDLLARDAGLRGTLEARAVAALPERLVSERGRTAYDLLALLVAIGGVSWLTMARVIRGQVLSLKSQPFVEAARAVGASPVRIFVRHLLPNLVGPIVVYATLTVPQAILQESFLSFLGIGVRPPVPSWGNLAAEGIADGINPHHLSDSRWWLLAFPCLLLGCTLLSLNFLGEGLREATDPRSASRSRSGTCRTGSDSKTSS